MYRGSDTYGQSDRKGGGGGVQGKFSTGNSLTFCNRDNTRLINHLFRDYTIFIFYPKKGIHIGHK